MGWLPDRDALRGRVAVVAGATRGAGRGIAAALGEAGATVVCTGRTTGTTRSEYDRPETIEETAELVTQLGGVGIASCSTPSGSPRRTGVTPSTLPGPATGRPLRPTFALSESPRYVGRAVAALAADPEGAYMALDKVSKAALVHRSRSHRARHEAKERFFAEPDEDGQHPF